MAMEESKLRNSLDIVFEKEMQDLYSGIHTSTVYDTKDGYSIRFPHADTLIQLYLTVRNNQKLRSFFIQSLEDGVVNSEGSMLLPPRTYLGISSLCFYSLVEVGCVNEAIDSLKKRKKGCEGLFHLIQYMLPKNYFDSTQLNDILSKTKQMEKTGGEWDSNVEGHKLSADIISYRYELLTKQISKINVEINEDKRVVSEKIGRLGLSESYNQLLDGIDDYIDTDTEKFINAGMISNLRTFMEDLLKDVANRIAEREQERIPQLPERREMGNIRGYLKEKLNLSENENKFVTSFIDILHAEGGHAFMSEKEYFRLARNIAIEIALFVLSKYEKKYA